MYVLYWQRIMWLYDLNLEERVSQSINQFLNHFSEIKITKQSSTNFHHKLLFIQIPPVSTWGRRFITAPFVRRLKGDIIRILSGEDNNIVKVQYMFKCSLCPIVEVIVPFDVFCSVR